MRPTHMLDPADRQRLETALVEAERSTRAEVAVAVVAACDPYAGAPWRLGVLLAVIADLAAGLLLPGLPAGVVLGLQAAALALGHGLCHNGMIRRHFVAESLMDARVAERAQRAFAQTGLPRAPGRTGVLIFVAVLERRIVVMADEGVQASLDPGDDWSRVVELVRQGLGTGSPVEGLLAAVAHTGQLLGLRIPGPARPVASLPARVLLED